MVSTVGSVCSKCRFRLPGVSLTFISIHAPRRLLQLLQTKFEEERRQVAFQRNLRGRHRPPTTPLSSSSPSSPMQESSTYVATIGDNAATGTPPSSQLNNSPSTSTLPPPRLIPLYFPALSLCTDNGAMVAWAGVEKLLQGISDSVENQEVIPRWPIGELLKEEDTEFLFSKPK